MPVTRERIVAVALELLDEAGLDGLTLRRLAERLGIRAPTLYWHVRNKRELLDLLAGAILEAALAAWREPQPGAPGGEVAHGPGPGHARGPAGPPGQRPGRVGQPPDRLEPARHRTPAGSPGRCGL